MKINIFDKNFMPYSESYTIVTAYLTARIDEQLNIQRQDNDRAYIRTIFDSCNASKTKCVILVDFDCQFEDTEYTSFIKYDHFSEETPHLRRFKLFQKFIKEYEYERYVMCDCQDVSILRNPFTQVVVDPLKLYVGSEPKSPMTQSVWINTRFSKIGINYDHFKDRRLLNCGIVGGYREILLDFFEKYVYTINSISHSNSHGNLNPAVIDMFSFNKVVYENYGNNLCTGSPLHTLFKAFDRNNTVACIAHK